MINLKNNFNDIVQDPFPHIYIDNFFQEDFLKKFSENA